MSNFFKSLPGIISVIGIIVLVFGPYVLSANLAADYRTVMQVVISVVVLGAGLYVILSNKYPAETLKWAYGVVGIVVGYWLPS